MTKKPDLDRKYDRLTAFLRAFNLRASTGPTSGSAGGGHNLYVLGGDRPELILYRCQGGRVARRGLRVLASAAIDFGCGFNPLLGALPEEVVIELAGSPQAFALAELLVGENETRRCGGETLRDRLCEIIVILAARKAIADGTVNASLLAGLADPVLCPVLVALHDAPSEPWTVASMAELSGLSRTQFNSHFTRVVGSTPGNYLQSWRLVVGHLGLRKGRSVKAVAADVGFGSQEAFSRAFSRKFGYPPSRATPKIQSAAA